MDVEIWSDVACPWCYIGKRHLEAALAEFEHAGEVNVTWRSYQLDPSAPAEVPGRSVEVIAQKYGLDRDQAQAAEARVSQTAAAAGLDYQLHRLRVGSTFDAHRLVHLAEQHGLQDAMKERLFRGRFVEGELMSDPETLVAAAVEIGLPEAEVRVTLGTDRFADDVRADEATARELGISGVCRCSLSTAGTARRALSPRINCSLCCGTPGRTAARLRHRPLRTQPGDDAWPGPHPWSARAQTG